MPARVGVNFRESCGFLPGEERIYCYNNAGAILLGRVAAGWTGGDALVRCQNG